MNKNRLITILLFVLVVLPGMAGALEMPTALSSDWGAANITAQSYIVLDADTGQMLVEKNSQVPWVPASLTKLVTALVFLDTKPNLNKIVTVKQSDQASGGCSIGGACLSTKAGVSYRLNDLFYASLMASANNATMAVSRATGLSPAVFVERMNAKAASLGAANTHFMEPTGMDPANVTTAEDYAKIVQAAFADTTIQKIATTQTYAFRSTNYKNYKHNLKNTDKLLADEDYTVLGAKTGYLDESQYNFAVKLKNRLDNNLIVVLFGSRNSATEFQEAKQLAALGGLTLAFSRVQEVVLGTSTATTINN